MISKMFCFFLLVGCGSTEAKVDPELASFVEDFLADARAFGVGEGHWHEVSSVGFADLGDLSLAGMCYTKSRKVEIASVHWPYQGPCVRRALLYHELGHCVLDLEHSEVKEDLMFHQLPDEASCVREFEAARRRFFEGVKFQAGPLVLPGERP